jgi:hypothetical protein
MVRAFIIYGVLLSCLLLTANLRGWAMFRSLNPGNWGTTQGGVYYHGGTFYHK